MLTLILLGLLCLAVLPWFLCGRGSRAAGVSWFDLLPYLTQSQKQRTRLQQKRRHGARRF